MSTKRTAGQGEFFAIDSATWRGVCELGMNHAVAYLVMARGTGRDNSTTMWSAEATFKHGGIAWRRADKAIKELIDNGIVVKHKEGKRPRYKLPIPNDKNELVWLPNTLVTGAAGEVPPIAKLRQTQEVDYLQAFIGLYEIHDLAGDGGLPRNLLWKPYETRERIYGFGPFDVVGFRTAGTRFCNRLGPLGIFTGEKLPSGDSDVWGFLTTLERLGLLEWVTYLAESDADDSELVHPLGGDEQADEVKDALAQFTERVPEQYSYEVEEYDFVLPIPNHMGKATLVGIGRLRYRPRTSRTSAWWAQHLKSCEKHAAAYRRLSVGEFGGEQKAAIGGAP